MSSRRKTPVDGRSSGHRYDVLKRALDLAGASIGIVVCSPLLACVAVAVAVRLGRPVLFVQERPGRGGIPFRLVKFRTMRGVDVSSGRVADEERLTRFGRVLRSTSLDELPELWNVLRGDMSFVGPRPLLMAYLDRYTAVQARRHEVRPGITGLAQVSGRNTVEWGARFTLDVEYVDARSVELDAKILWWTVIAVLRRDGTTAEGYVTMPEFTGERGHHES